MAIQLIRNQESGSKNEVLLNDNSLASMHLNVYASKIAFTLAEVLITLGIIGVVAALTLPTLIQHHRKSVVETRLAKFYSVMNQAVQMAETEYGDKKSWTLDEEHKLWQTYLKPHVKYVEEKIIDGKLFVHLPDGSGFVPGVEMAFYPYSKNYNGDTSNKYGRQAFRFAFYPNNNSEALKFHKNKGVEPYTGNWNGEENSLYSREAFGCMDTPGTVIGSFCTAVIQRNGWKIPDNYPFKF